jgi:hypothetical protein
LHDSVYLQPKLKSYEKALRVELRQHSYDLLFNKKGRSKKKGILNITNCSVLGKHTASIEISVTKVNANNDDMDWDLMFEDYENYATINFPTYARNKSKDKNGSDDEKFKKKFIKELELKHVTTVDLTAVLAALKLLEKGDRDNQSDNSDSD